MKNFKRILSVLLVVMMVATMFVPSMAAETEVTPYVSSNGATMTIHNLDSNVKDFFIAEGTFSTYREMKEAGYLFNATAAKIAGQTEYSYVVTNGGDHTVIIRYNDGSQAIIYHTIEVTDPVFTTNGLQVTISNLDDVRMIRTAYGEHDTIKSIKATDGFRNFSDKTEIKGRDTYTIQYREEGLVTIVVEYNHGYKVFYNYYVFKNVPTVEQGADYVKFGELNNLYNIRYALGEYSTASEIKAASGSKAVKASAIDEEGYITVSNLAVGTYTFCVQYTDESFNFYVIEITGEDPTPELGAYENPYLINVGDTRVAAYIPAGETVYVKATDANNTVFTLGYATAATYEIWYLRTQYTANTESGNNDTSFTMVSDVDTFGITNTGDEAITVYMALEAGAAVDNTGTMENPEELTLAANMWGGVGASAGYTFEAGNEGRYYKVVAPADGEIVFSMQGAVDADWNNIGWFYFVQNLTAGKYGDNHWSDDETPVYDEAWTVSAGDELLIFVSTYDPANMWANPAGTVNFQLAFNAVGSYDNPLSIEAGYYTVEMAEASQGMYYSFVAPDAGTVEVIMYSENWQYVVNNITAGTYGDTHWSDDETPVTCETLTVAAGDELQIMVNTYDPANPYTAPAGTVTWELTFTGGSTEEPEYELGAYENPYIVNAGDTRVAAYIPAGETVYVKATDANNSTFTLGYATAATYEIWYLRTQYTADTESGNNDTSFTMVSDVDTFGITNTGEEDITVYMALEAGAAVEDTSGTMDNPEELTLTANMWGGVGASAGYTFEAGNSGRYYKVVAPSDGQIVFNMQGAVDADWNNIGWQYNVQNLTAAKYGDNHWSDDETPVYDEAWTVSAGDELLIFVSTYDPANMWANPAGTVNFQLAFNAVGSYDYPAGVAGDGVYTATVEEGSQGYYYSWTANQAGTLTVQMISADGWTYVVNNTTAGTYGDTHWCNDETLVAYETIDVAAGDIISIMVNTYDPANEWTAPAGSVEWSLNFTAEGKAYTITLDADGGVLNAPTTYACNQNDTYFDIFGGYYPVPTLEGYNFVGWYNEKYGFTLTEGDINNGGAYVVAEDNGFVALWEEA